MKILIVSDTHGHERNLKKVIEKVGTDRSLYSFGRY